MKDEEQAKKMAKFGSIPQLSMIGLFILQTYLYSWSDSDHWTIWISHAGGLLFLFCLLRLYGFGKKQARFEGLITNGPFRYTRHPMYTGLFLMNLAFWLPSPASTEWHFFVLQALFLIGLLSAGWFQERETLHRYGKEAELYYSKTPRLFLLYPLRWL